jgi:hypothetical protein
LYRVGSCEGKALVQVRHSQIGTMVIRVREKTKKERSREAGQ